MTHNRTSAIVLAGVALVFGVAACGGKLLQWGYDDGGIHHPGDDDL